MGSRKPNSGQFEKGQPPWNKGKKAGLIPWNKGKTMTEEFRQKVSISLKPHRKKLSETETTIRFCSHRFNFWKLNKGKLRGLFVPYNTTSISERKV